MYDKIDADAADTQEGHSILTPSAPGSVSDVLAVALAASDLQHIAAKVPGFTREMMNVADLLYTAEYAMVQQLNNIVSNLGLAPSSHISDAIGRANSIFIAVAERDALQSALDQFFVVFAGDKAQQCRSQWSTCVSWTRQRLSVAHPRALYAVGDAASLAERLRQLYAAIQHEPAYADVRETATVLTEQLAEFQHISL